MLERFQFETFEAGTDVMREGEIEESCFIITSGTAQVLRSNIGVVASLGAGNTFGEVTGVLLMCHPYSNNEYRQHLQKTMASGMPPSLQLPSKSQTKRAIRLLS